MRNIEGTAAGGAALVLVLAAGAHPVGLAAAAFALAAGITYDILQRRAA